MARKPKELTIDGISFEYDESRLDDVRVVFAIGKLSDDTVGDEEKMKWYVRLMEMLFGDPFKVMNDLAEKHGGKVTLDDYNEFFFKMLEGMNAKN